MHKGCGQHVGLWVRRLGLPGACALPIDAGYRKVGRRLQSSRNALPMMRRLDRQLPVCALPILDMIPGNLSRILPVVAILSLFPITVSEAQTRPELGIEGKSAPEWGVTQWINLPENHKSLDVGDLRGRVLYIYAFQSWCPGCHAHGFPTLQKIIEHFGDDPAVGIVAIQTTFEGFGTNTFERAKEVARRYDLDIPVGQSGEPDKPSVFMRAYRSGGTPWTVIVGPDGIVRYNGFHIQPDAAIERIEKLKPEN